MSLSFRFIQSPVSGEYLKILRKAKTVNFGESTATVLKPERGRDFVFTDNQNGQDLFMLAMVFVSGCGAIAVLSTKQSEENWEINYNKLRGSLGNGRIPIRSKTKKQ